MERIGLGILDMVCHLVEERVEEFLHRPPSSVAVVGVDANQTATAVVSAQHPSGGSDVHVDLEIKLEEVESIEAGAKQRAEG